MHVTDNSVKKRMLVNHIHSPNAVRNCIKIEQIDCRLKNSAWNEKYDTHSPSQLYKHVTQNATDVTYPVKHSIRMKKTISNIRQRRRAGESRHIQK